MAERILQLAERLDDAEMKFEASVFVGSILAFADPQGGSAYLEKAVASYDLERPRAGRQVVGSYPAVVGLAVSAIFLWMLGYPDRAHKRAADSILVAQRLNHPYSITYALFHSGLLHVWMRNYEIARERAQTLLDLAERHGFHIWRAVGRCLLGATEVQLGSPENGAPPHRTRTTYLPEP